MRKWLSIFFIALIGMILVNQTPVMGSDLKNEKIVAKDYSVISDEKQTLRTFPPQGKSLVIFWASWCGPCKIEMARLRSSVESGKIKPDQIFAINPFETLADAKKFVLANIYPFIFINATDVGHDLSISSTPTTIFLEGEKIISRNSGMSFLGIWKAEKFLR